MKKSALCFYSGIFLFLLTACFRQRTPAPAPTLTAGWAEMVAIADPLVGRIDSAFVILPAAYRTHPRDSFPVVYLLHGYSGNYTKWLSNSPDLPDLATRCGCLIVTPDGGYASWYFDSPLDSSFRYETYIAKVVPQYVDTHYRTITSPAGRAITGLSMGGHGALFLALRHPETFGAAGSMSGGVDLQPFPDSWEIKKRIGDQGSHPGNWKRYSVTGNLDRWTPRQGPALFIDCGVDDFFFPVNEALHKTLLEKGIPHDYIVRPGAHNWAYWTNALPYHLLFFADYFRNSTAK